MARTQATGVQIADETVQRSDLDSVTAGQAVIKKIIAGTGISISFTGVDAGTGDVTINTTAGAAAAISVSARIFLHMGA